MKSKLQMRTVGHDEYLRLREGARTIEADRYGDKVLLLPDETYVKLFRRKRLLTSAAFYPYAVRFSENLAALTQLSIPCPTMIALYRITLIDRDAVHYKPLVGRTLRHIVQAGPNAADAECLRLALAEFVARLHGLGVYFRSLHLGNIVLTPVNTLGLIDVADMSLRQRSLGRLLRMRNMKHLLRYPVEGMWLCEGGSFFDAYNHASGYRLSA